MPQVSSPRPEDIVILGAGPAGLTASLFLGRAGIPHTIVNRDPFPRDKVDGNVYGGKVLETLTRLDPEWVDELLANPEVLRCRAARLFFSSDRYCSVGFCDRDGLPMAFSLSRYYFDAFLASKLDLDYTHCRFGVSVTGVERSGDRLAVTVEDGSGVSEQLRPKVVLGADGIDSIVARSLQPRSSAPRLYNESLVAVFKNVSGFAEPYHFEGHFLPELAPSFFFITPLANGTFKVGVSISRHHMQRRSANLEQVFEEALANHSALAPRFAKAERIGAIESWPIDMSLNANASIAGDNFLLLGDAAGLTNPVSKFGTGNAMVSGRLAAERVAAAIEAGDFSAARLADYDREVRSSLSSGMMWGERFAHLFKLPAGVLNQLAVDGSFVKTTARRFFNSRKHLLKSL